MSVDSVRVALPEHQLDGDGSNPISTLHIAHQKMIREQRRILDEKESLFGAWWKTLDVDISKAIVRETNYETAAHIIETYEWLGGMAANHKWYYGIFWGQFCGGVVVFGTTTSGALAKSVCGEEYAQRVIQLQRGACVHWAHPHAASKLISVAVRMIAKKGIRIVVAFSDPDAGEIGTVYQATNWIYSGKTCIRPDYFYKNGGGRITGHVGPINSETMERRPRPRKHRYCIFTGPKSEVDEIRKAMLWPVLPYPKRTSTVKDGDNHANARNQQYRPLPLAQERSHFGPEPQEPHAAVLASATFGGLVASRDLPRHPAAVLVRADTAADGAV